MQYVAVLSKYLKMILKDMNNWKFVNFRITNDDGRCPGLITKENFIAGVYKMRFETGKYWDAFGETSFYPYVEVWKNYMFYTSNFNSWTCGLNSIYGTISLRIITILIGWSTGPGMKTTALLFSYNNWYCPFFQIVFTITNTSQHYHVPLLLSRFFYSTYRGS